MNNYIERRSLGDPRSVAPEPISASDWIRRREGRPDWNRIARRLEYSGRLGEVSVPTLVLCGRHDPQFPPAASRELADGIDCARSVWFDRSGPYPYVEEPDAFWSAVGRFLMQPVPAAESAPRSADGLSDHDGRTRPCGAAGS